MIFLSLSIFTLFHLPFSLPPLHLPRFAQVVEKRLRKPSATVAQVSRNQCHYDRSTGKPKQIVRSRYYELFEKYCPEQMHWLPAVCYSENRSQIDDAVGPGGRGPCMINPIHKRRAGSGSLLEAETNVKVACSIAREQGGAPWTDYCNGNWNNYQIIR